jgi:hypothetical protein
VTTLHVGERSWLRTDEQWLHRFGPVDAPLLVLNTADDDGSEWWCDEPVGWLAPTATTPIDERPYGDGGYDGDTTYGPRALTFGAPEPGLTVCPDRPTALRAYRQLLAVASSRTAVLYTAPDDDGEWSLLLRASGQPNLRWVDDRSFEWSFVMVAPDPWKFDARQAAEVLTTGLPEEAPGAVFPWTFPVVFGAADASAGTVEVVNTGDEDAQARYVLRGPAQRPTVVNDTTGVEFRIARDLGLGDVLTVDTRSATVRLNGVSVFVDFSGSFPLIAPGPNTIRWFHEGPHLPAGEDGASTLSVTAASTRK